MSEHILLINHDFPPNQGIGGRRWAKLAKGLAKLGYKIHVVNATPIENNKTSPWSADVNHENIFINTIPRTYPTVISHTGNSLWDKLHYRFAIWRLKQTVKGTIYDLSAEWGRYLIPACERICSEFPISRIIATGAPWHMLYELGEWNSANRKLPYIIDFRDPWLNAKNYGMSQLNPKRKAFEVFKQKKTLENATIVLSPYPEILHDLKEFARNNNSSIGQLETLRHFYDEDDFTNIVETTSPNRSENMFTIVYGGDLYQDIHSELLEIVAFFNGTNTLLTPVELQIYTDATVPEFMRGIEGIRIFPTAGKSFYSIAKAADALLILLPKHKSHEFTTKFYDYMPLGKPYIIASQGGIVADFIVGNQMGYLWKSGLHYPWYENLLADSFNFQPSYDISAHSLTAAAKQLTSLFK
ncbi:MAG: hypothetical protein ACK478_08375 [Flavobacteriales bacterium]|jgi:hypothetical protein